MRIILLGLRHAGRGIAGVVVALSIGSAVAFAQVAGNLSGTVKDSSGGAVPGATVTATNTAITTQVIVTTDGQGFYSLLKLPVGRYELLIQLEGFKPVKRTDLVVDAAAANSARWSRRRR